MINLRYIMSNIGYIICIRGYKQLILLNLDKGQ